MSSRRSSAVVGSGWGLNAGNASRRGSSVSRRRSVVQVLSDTFNNNFDEETETNKLEAEIAEEEKPAPKSKLSRLRRKGTQILHSKHVLLMIVLLNVIDCLLVTGELILDIHYIKGILDDSDLQSETFLDKMEERYPDNLNGHDIDHLEEFYESIYSATCYWDGDQVGNCSNVKTRRRLLQVQNDNVTETIGEAPETSDVKAKEAHAHSIWEDIAHGLHKASIAILAVLSLEVLMKIFFMGKKFFEHNIEVFDAVIVIASLILDLVFLKGLTIYRIQDGIVILSFLLPWRVIRVVNSLIVAVLDHEHFRLKMIYKQKKMIACNLEAEEESNDRLKDMLTKIEEFLEREGMPRWKYLHYTHFEERNVSIASMATHTLKSMMDNFASHTPMKNNNEEDVNAKSNNNELNGIVILENGISLENKPHNDKVPTSNGHSMHESESFTTLDIVEEEADDDILECIQEQTDDRGANDNPAFCIDEERM